MNRTRTRPHDSWMTVLVLALCVCAVALASCAHKPPKRRVGVSIESRPTPAQPDTGVVAGSSTSGSSSSEPSTTSKPRTVVMSNQTLRTTLGGVAADTTAARAALLRCVGKKLLPDQEGVFDATTVLLMDVRATLATGDFPRAQSLARQARQLAASLKCR